MTRNIFYFLICIIALQHSYTGTMEHTSINDAFENLNEELYNRFVNTENSNGTDSNTDNTSEMMQIDDENYDTPDEADLFDEEDLTSEQWIELYKREILRSIENKERNMLVHKLSCKHWGKKACNRLIQEKHPQIKSYLKERAQAYDVEFLSIVFPERNPYLVMASNAIHSHDSKQLHELIVTYNISNKLRAYLYRTNQPPIDRAVNHSMSKTITHAYRGEDGHVLAIIAGTSFEHMLRDVIRNQNGSQGTPIEMIARSRDMHVLYNTVKHIANAHNTYHRNGASIYAQALQTLHNHAERIKTLLKADLQRNDNHILFHKDRYYKLPTWLVVLYYGDQSVWNAMQSHLAEYLGSNDPWKRVLAHAVNSKNSVNRDPHSALKWVRQAAETGENPFLLLCIYMHGSSQDSAQNRHEESVNHMLAQQELSQGLQQYAITRQRKVRNGTQPVWATFATEDNHDMLTRALTQDTSNNTEMATQGAQREH